jgi:hypothetical protein
MEKTCHARKWTKQVGKKGLGKIPVHPELKRPFQRKEDSQDNLVATNSPTHPGTEEGRRLTTRKFKQHPNAVCSEGPGEEVIFSWETLGTMTG